MSMSLIVIRPVSLNFSSTSRSFSTFFSIKIFSASSKRHCSRGRYKPVARHDVGYPEVPVGQETEVAASHDPLQVAIGPVIGTPDTLY